MNIYKSFFGNNQSNTFENNLTQTNENNNLNIHDTSQNQNNSNSYFLSVYCYLMMNNKSLDEIFNNDKVIINNIKNLKNIEDFENYQIILKNYYKENTEFLTNLCNNLNSNNKTKRLVSNNNINQEFLTTLSNIAQPINSNDYFEIKRYSKKNNDDFTEQETQEEFTENTNYEILESLKEEFMISEELTEQENKEELNTLTTSRSELLFTPTSSSLGDELSEDENQQVLLEQSLNEETLLKNMEYSLYNEEEEEELSDHTLSEGLTLTEQDLLEQSLDEENLLKNMEYSMYRDNEELDNNTIELNELDELNDELNDKLNINEEFKNSVDEERDDFNKNDMLNNFNDVFSNIFKNVGNEGNTNNFNFGEILKGIDMKKMCEGLKGEDIMRFEIDKLNESFNMDDMINNVNMDDMSKSFNMDEMSKSFNMEELLSNFNVNINKVGETVENEDTLEDYLE